MAASWPKAARVRKRARFLAVQQRGGKTQGGHFLLFVLETKNAETEPTQLGITVSKRVGNAVIRNRVKRYWREVCRQNRNWFPAHGVEAVFVARPSAAALDFAKTEQEISRLCRRTFRQ